MLNELFSAVKLAVCCSLSVCVRYRIGNQNSNDGFLFITFETRGKIHR